MADDAVTKKKEDIKKLNWSSLNSNKQKQATAVSWVF